MSAFVDSRGIDQWPATGTSVADSAQTVTRPAAPGKRHGILSYVVAARSGTPGTAITMVIKDGAIPIWRDTLNGASGWRAAHQFAKALLGSVGNALSVEVAAGGTTVITECSIEGFTSV